MLKPGIILRAIVLFIFITITSQAYAEINTKPRVVNTTGTGAIIDDHTSAAKDKAISNGLIAAVESVLSDILQPEVLVANFTTITDILYAHTSNFIDDYKILAETKHKSDYRVMVKSTVSTKKILIRLNDAGIVLDPANKHKVLFLLSENNLQDIAPQFWWGQGMAYIKTISDSAITQAMKKKGFAVLSHRLVNRGLIYNEQVGEPFTETLSAEDIVNLGLYFNADVVVSGSAKADQAPNTMGEDRTFTGKLTLDIYRTDSAEKVGTVTAGATTVNTDETTGGNDALIEASIEAANNLGSKINIAMKKEVEKSTMIEVVVEGTDFFKNYAKLIKRVKGMPEIKNITQREKRPTRAIIVIECMGNGKIFAKKVMAETFKNFGLSISEVSRNHVRLEMIPMGSGLFSR